MITNRAELVTNLIDLIIGSTTTIGETNADNKAIANLKETNKIMYYELDAIVYEYEATLGAYEASRKVSHDIAKKVLEDVVKYINYVLKEDNE